VQNRVIQKNILVLGKKLFAIEIKSRVPLNIFFDFGVDFDDYEVQ